MKNKLVSWRPRSYIADVAYDRPKNGISVIPSWYKKIPLYAGGETKIKLQNSSPNTSIKACSPFLDAISSGYYLCLESDVLVSWEDGQPLFKWRTVSPIVESHHPDQHAGFPISEEYFNQGFKWVNEFFIELPDGYSMFFMHPSNRLDLPFFSLSGFVDLDIYPGVVHFPFVIKNGFSGVIEKGTPLIQMIPVKRDSWESTSLPYSKEEGLKRDHKFASKIIRSYKNQFWQKKEYR
jgi:hypothetical protein